MSEEKHTPGPWTIGYTDGSGALIDDSNGAYVVGPWMSGLVIRGGEKEGIPCGVLREQDARLIAASPDLLAAIRRIFREVSVCGSSKCADMGHPAPCRYRQAMDAIEKAEGR